MKSMLLMGFILICFSLKVHAFTNKATVVTSTFFLASIVNEISHDKINVSYIIPPSENPHLFSPTPKSLENLSKAKLFIGIGYGFEFWLDNIHDLLKGKKVLLLSTYFKHPINKRIVGNIIIANPHIWLDMNFMENTGIKIITEKLCTIDSNNCKYFKKNALQLKKKVGSILNMYERFFSKIHNVCFINVDPAFAYFLRSFGKKPCASILSKGNEEPSLGDIVNVAKACKCERGLALYAFHPQTAKMIYESLGYTPVFLNPLGNPTKSYLNNYLKILIYNFDKLKKAIQK